MQKHPIYENFGNPDCRQRWKVPHGNNAQFRKISSPPEWTRGQDPSRPLGNGGHRGCRLCSRPRASHIGVAFLGGFSIDGPTMEASRIMERSGRREFLYDDPEEELCRQASLVNGSGIVCGLNLRGATPESFANVASQIGDQVIYEIDAHCRQAPMVEARSGEYLLSHSDLLAEEIRALKREDVTVSVKIRAGVSPDDRRLAKKIWTAGADIIHVDLMDYDYQKIRQIRNSCPLVLIANNSMNTFDRVRDMFSHGADLVSLARNADLRTLAGLDAAIERHTDEHGWYNAPKQLCRGGDVRALTFCCMPVKDCPLLPPSTGWAFPGKSTWN